MSIFVQDIINEKRKLGYVLCSEQGSSILGVYTVLSSALKGLFLADEKAVLRINYLDVKSKPCINDTYDTYIGSVYINDNEIVYQRNLTDECEEIEETDYIEEEDLLQIKQELEQIEEKKKKNTHNTYHTNAHDAAYKAIVQKFNQLSSLLTGQLSRLMKKANDHGMELEYDTFHKANKLYQETNEKMDDLTLEEKVDIIKEIEKCKKNANDEITTLVEMLKELGEEDVKRESETDDDFSKYGFDFGNNDNNGCIDLRNFYQQHKSAGKILYDSPTSSPQKKEIIVIAEPKPKKEGPKKNVGFDMEKTEVHLIKETKEDNN